MSVKDITVSPIGRSGKVRNQRIFGIVLTYRPIGNSRVFQIETRTGDRFDVAEADFVFEGEAEPSARDEGVTTVEHIPMKEYARRIVAEDGFAATVSPQAMQALARDYLDLARRASL
jgi:hypothetical protein